MEQPGTGNFNTMTPWERDMALLDLITSLSLVSEIQSEALAELQDSVKTLELSTVV